MIKRDINSEFVAALVYFIKNKQGVSQRFVARQIGISEQKLNNVIHGSRQSTEEERRAAALLLDYENYDDFLKFGRSILGLEKDIVKPLEPVNAFMHNLLKRIKRLDPSGIKAVSGMLDALDAAKTNLQAQQTAAGPQKQSNTAASLNSIEAAECTRVSNDVINKAFGNKGGRIERVAENVVDNIFNNGAVNSERTAD